MSATKKKPALDNNPWKGLNFYREGEILYGRDDEIQSLALYVTNNTQTVLYGKSGIGKSSIINAGLFPIARNEGLFPIPIRLKHDKDTTYISQIKTAFEESRIGITPILDAIDNSKETLWEYLHRNTFYHTITNKPVRPLIVLDQFEEIFTLQHDEKKKEAFFSELADLLNEVMPNYIVNDVNPKVEKKAPNLISNENDFAFDFGVAENFENGKRKEYLSESLFNIVFTIREDFLSYLERYTRFIPVMKTNRYALLPISEEQAKDIIMKPIEGLVDIEVAKLIIQKVSGRTDFELGDAPEIEVDAAVLSLYLSRLYTKKGEKTPTITAVHVNEFSEDIIKDFYEESIGDLPTQEIEKLEDLLLTYDNRRNNVSRNDLIREGVSEKLIYTLVEKRKLLRQFSYQEDIRIEYIHDILCDVVKERIENREQLAKEKEEKEYLEKERKIQEEKLKKAEEEKQLLLRKQKKNKHNRIFLIIIIIVATIISPIFYNSLFPPAHWELLLLEDQTVGSENYWKAEVLILNESSDTLYPVQVLDKTHFQATYPPKVNEVRVVVQFLAGNFNTIDTVMDMRDSLIIPISRAHGRKKYGGKVIGEIAKQPLKNAVVIVGSQIAKTDHKGLFTVYVEQTDISNDGSIKIFKSGYNLLETKIGHDSTFYTLQLEDPKAFDRRLSLTKEKITEVPDSIIEMTGEIAGSLCHVEACIKSDSIYGIYYYDKSIKQENNIELVKIVFSGKLNSDKTFHLDACDRVYNLEEFNGRINDDGSWEGYWHSYSPVLQNFKFKRN